MDRQRADPYVLSNSESRDIPGGVQGFKIRAVDSAGLVSFFEFTLGAWESGPPLHLHGTSDESFYVLEGDLEMVEDEKSARTAASYSGTGRLGEWPDIVPAIIFLCTPEAGWITAQTMRVNGGMAA